MNNKTLVFFFSLAALMLLSGGAWAADSNIFAGLVERGRFIFEDLRELVYIAAGFGIIAVGISGIFGNLNWKWLSAIIVSLVIVATAGELLYAMLGDNDAEISNTTTENANAVTLRK